MSSPIKLNNRGSNIFTFADLQAREKGKEEKAKSDSLINANQVVQKSIGAMGEYLDLTRESITLISETKDAANQIHSSVQETNVQMLKLKEKLSAALIDSEQQNSIVNANLKGLEETSDQLIRKQQESSVINKASEKSIEDFSNSFENLISYTKHLETQNQSLMSKGWQKICSGANWVKKKFQ